MLLTVIICTHNPRTDYLHRVFDALRKQTLPKDQWELIVVDNASKVPLAGEWNLSWHPNGRHVVEETLGLAAARQCGIRCAKSELLVFVDDDNVLDSEYLSKAIVISEEWPKLGAWGSNCIAPEFEIPCSTHLEKRLYVGRINEGAYWGNVPFCAETTPWGAGLCVRVKVAQAYRSFYERSAIHITDRLGKELSGGGDTEFSMIACTIGLGVAVFPELRMTHLISRERLTDDYVLKFIKGNTASDILLAYKWRGIVPRSPFSLRSVLSMVKKIMLHRGFDRYADFATWRGAVEAKRIIDTTRLDNRKTLKKCGDQTAQKRAP